MTPQSPTTVAVLAATMTTRSDCGRRPRVGRIASWRSSSTNAPVPAAARAWPASPSASVATHHAPQAISARSMLPRATRGAHRAPPGSTALGQCLVATRWPTAPLARRDDMALGRRQPICAPDRVTLDGTVARRRYKPHSAVDRALQVMFALLEVCPRRPALVRKGTTVSAARHRRPRALRGSSPPPRRQPRHRRSARAVRLVGMVEPKGYQIPSAQERATRGTTVLQCPTRNTRFHVRRGRTTRSRDEEQRALHSAPRATTALAGPPRPRSTGAVVQTSTVQTLG